MAFIIGKIGISLLGSRFSLAYWEKGSKIVLTLLLGAAMLNMGQTPENADLISLNAAPEEVSSYKEIAITYDDSIAKLYNALSPEERVFAYYIFRASLPGNRIATDFTHRHGLEITALFEHILANAEQIELDNKDQFIKEIKTYLIYLWTNHGQYFERESSEEKRTPERLELNTLNKDNLTKALRGTPFADRLDELDPFIFDEKFESTCTVPGSIESSAVNIYGPNLTEEDYNSLPASVRNQINAHFYVEEVDGKRVVKAEQFSASDKYSKELSTAVFWLKKAHEHAAMHPQKFDVHLLKSLEHLIKFLSTGDEQWFKEHSIEWLKSDSNLDYCFGFIETYQDPKSLRGSFQAEVTIKSVDIKKLNAILPGIEEKLPIPKQYQREDLGGKAAIPNASINTLLFGSGNLGPTITTAAYCLPNYAEIRSEHGSKQIIYPSTKGIGAKLNPELSLKLFNLTERYERMCKVDPDMKLENDIWDLQCILHETLGHGSGKLASHTFVEGDKLTIEGKTYNVGDTIPVTSSNLTEFLGGYDQTLEELRAEVNALYVSIHHLDELIANGFMSEWAKKMSLEELQSELILGMAGTAFRRYIQQSDNATKISGDHARANCTIMNYLIEQGALTRHVETIEHDGKEYSVVGIKITELQKCKDVIKELMVLVQTIKSTGDGIGVKKLIDTHGIPLKYPEDLKCLKANQKAIVGDIKSTAHIFPHFIPIKDKSGNVVDIRAEWPKDLFEQYAEYKNIELSTESF